MTEAERNIIKRIDELLGICKNDSVYGYEKIIFEVEQLVVTIAGKDSEEYKNYVNLYSTKGYYNYEKMPYIIGILNAIRNKVIINGIHSDTKSSWDELLHPVIHKIAYKKFRDKYYSESVESSIKELNTRAKSLYKQYRLKELDGGDLFANIFNNDKDKCLLIAGNDLESQSGKDEQEGFRFLFMGLWKALRNPNAHANTILSEKQAIERLIFISMLMYKLDECIAKASLKE